MRDIPGYEGIYAVTEDGRVWRYPRTWRSGRNGSHVRSVGGAWLKQSHRGKYLGVALTKDGRERTHNVHRLVALAWVPNPGNLPQVNHIDGAKHRNVAANLEWTTPGGNTRHAWAAGLAKTTPRMIAAGNENLARVRTALSQATQSNRGEEGLSPELPSTDAGTHIPRSPEAQNSGGGG